METVCVGFCVAAVTDCVAVMVMETGGVAANVLVHVCVGLESIVPACVTVPVSVTVGDTELVGCTELVGVFVIIIVGDTEADALEVAVALSVGL